MERMVDSLSALDHKNKNCPRFFFFRLQFSSVQLFSQCRSSVITSPKRGFVLKIVLIEMIVYTPFLQLNTIFLLLDIPPKSQEVRVQ